MNIIQLIKSDPRVQSVDDERHGSNDDGFWVYLKPGYNNGDDGAHAIHEDSPSDCALKMGLIELCNCAECKRELKRMIDSDNAECGRELKRQLSEIPAQILRRK